jgi:hypothetical protein
MVWRCEPDWQGETAFIIAGGPSVKTQNLELLTGRKVIVINSSVYIYPKADILFFGDSRWYRDCAENRAAVQAFQGLVVTTSSLVKVPKVKNALKVNPPGLSQDRRALMIKRTSLTGAINLAVHLGVKSIVLLGADGRAHNGATHHHKPHKWPVRPGCWDVQKLDLITIVKPLAAMGIKVINASPGSAYADLWPVMTLDDAFNEIIGPSVEMSIAS